MSNNSDEKKPTITEEQAARAAETILNAWLKNDNNCTTSKKDTNKK